MIDRDSQYNAGAIGFKSWFGWVPCESRIKLGRTVGESSDTIASATDQSHELSSTATVSPIVREDVWLPLVPNERPPVSSPIGWKAPLSQGKRSIYEGNTYAYHRSSNQSVK